MKTPRELLLDRQRAAEPQLDSVRRKALAALSPVPAQSARDERTRLTWRELLLSLRWHLTGLGAAWLVVLFLNAEPATGPATHLAQENAQVPRPLVASIQEYRRRCLEVLEVNGTPAEPHPAAMPPRRRSEYQLQTAIA